MSDYLRKLKSHPGVPIATAFTVFGGVAGLQNDHMGFFMGALVSGIVVWIPVLITARSQP